MQNRLHSFIPNATLENIKICLAFFFFLRCMCKYEGWRSGELSAFLSHVQLQELNTDLFFNRHNKANTIFSREELSSVPKSSQSKIHTYPSNWGGWQHICLNLYYKTPLSWNIIKSVYFLRNMRLIDLTQTTPQKFVVYWGFIFRRILTLWNRFLGKALQILASLHELLRLWDTSPARSKRLDLGTRIPVTQLSPGSGALSSLHLLL